MKLKKGDKAPMFEGIDHDGKKISLKDYSGKKVVLYFYPKDGTPGCTIEACNLRDNYHMLQAKGYTVLGISSDSPESHKKFKTKKELPFTLIADEDHSIHEMYGTWVKKKIFFKKYMGTDRVTFLIDEKGVIEDIIQKVNVKNHTDQILKTEK